MKDSVLDIIEELTNASGVSGNEGPARKVMEKHIEQYADEVIVDNLGSLIARKGHDGPKVLIAGHLDEVGFMVTRITDDGFIKFQTLGGWWEQVMLAQRVKILTRKGELLGIIGSKPPHILKPEDRKKPVDVKEMFVDIGAKDKKEAEEFGVRPGDSIIPDSKFTLMNNPNLIMAKALDNRLGCAAAIEVFKRIKDKKHNNILYGVGTVQEEVGLRGAQTSAFTVKPDIAFSIDTGLAGDTPGIGPDDANSKLGNGPQLHIFDASMLPHRGLRDFVISVAEEENIPFQYATIPFGGTDAGRFHVYGDGVPSLFIGIPTRYVHSHASIFHRDDYENAINLLIKLVERLDEKTVLEIKKNS